MPIYEYECSKGHQVQKLFPTFREAAKFEDEINCPVCGDGSVADRVSSTPFPAHLYGNPDGYHSPSPTKRFSYKKSMSTGNATSMG